MTDYVKYLEDTNAPIWAKRDVERLLGQFSTDATVDQNGIVRWKKSGRVPPEDILSLWAHVGKPFNLVFPTKPAKLKRICSWLITANGCRMCFRVRKKCLKCDPPSERARKW